MTENRAENEGGGVSTEPDAPRTQATPGSVPTKSSLPTALIAVAGVVVAALLVGVGFLGWGYLQDRAAEQARTDAVQAATVQAAAMLSYNFNEVDQQLAAAGDGLTGDFKADYDKLVKETIAPGAKEKKITVEATVQAGAIESASPNDAVVLLYVNQITTSEEMPDAATTGSRVRMEMHKDGDRWLTGRLSPV
ncbi:Mce-associated membrane protein [Rhodococcus sp. OK519]|uniref:h domain protein n=1 Tax=Rhodococcus sp. OK519 TaxID=2135729 RepID=UPI000D4E9356|nr:Mce-associated membrane protein [Rhodococcus sp. OK519]